MWQQSEEGRGEVKRRELRGKRSVQKVIDRKRNRRNTYVKGRERAENGIVMLVGKAKPSRSLVHPAGTNPESLSDAMERLGTWRERRA